MKHTTETITFSLPPAMAAQVRAVMQAEGRTMSDLVREALRLVVEREDSLLGQSEGLVTRG